jgi:hypothetical protein
MDLGDGTSMNDKAERAEGQGAWRPLADLGKVCEMQQMVG